MNKRPELHDVMYRFLDRPGELDIVIHNREHGIDSEDMKRWKDYSLELLQEGRLAIARKRRMDFRKGILEILGAWLAIFIQFYFLVLSETPGRWLDVEPAFEKTCSLVLIAAPIFLFNWIFYGGDTGTYNEYRRVRLDTAWRRSGTLAVIVTIFNLITLFVGALLGR